MVFFIWVPNFWIYENQKNGSIISTSADFEEWRENILLRYYWFKLIQKFIYNSLKNKIEYMLYDYHTFLSGFKDVKMYRSILLWIWTRKEEEKRHHLYFRIEKYTCLNTKLWTSMEDKYLITSVNFLSPNFLIHVYNHLGKLRSRVQEFYLCLNLNSARLGKIITSFVDFQSWLIQLIHFKTSASLTHLSRQSNFYRSLN